MRFARTSLGYSPDAVSLIGLGSFPRLRPSRQAFISLLPCCRDRDIPDFWCCAAACDARPLFRVQRIHPASSACFDSTISIAGADLISRLVASKGRRKSGAFPEVLSPSVRWPCRAVRCCRQSGRSRFDVANRFVNEPPCGVHSRTDSSSLRFFAAFA